MSCYFLKDATSEIKTSITDKAPPKDIDADSMVISSPVRPVLDSSAQHTELEKSSSANLMPDTAEHITSPIELNAADNEELIKLEQAATKAQAAFRGYLVIFSSLIRCLCQLKALLVLCVTCASACCKTIYLEHMLLTTLYLFLEISFITTHNILCEYII